MTRDQVVTAVLVATGVLVSLLSYRRSGRRDDFDALRDEQRRQYLEWKEADDEEDVKVRKDWEDRLASVEKRLTSALEEIKGLEEALDHERNQRHLAVDYSRSLAAVLAKNGIPVPPPPDGLELT